MGLSDNLGRACLGLLWCVTVAPVGAAPREPLVVTRLSEPDPSFAAEPNTLQSADADFPLSPELESFGRQISQADRDLRQAHKAACNSVESARSAGASVSPSQYACRYKRY